MKEILNKHLQSQVRDSFVELKEPVGILLFRGTDLVCEECQQTEQLLKEVSALSDKLELIIFKTGDQVRPEIEINNRKPAYYCNSGKKQ